MKIVGKFEYPIRESLLMELLKAFFESPLPFWMPEIVKIDTKYSMVSNVLEEGRIIVSVVDQSYETTHEVEITKATMVKGIVALAEGAFGENPNGRLLLLHDLINHKINNRVANYFFQNLIFGGTHFKVE